MRVFRLVSIGLCLAAVILIMFRTPSYQVIEGEIFGTYYTIKIRGAQQTADIKKAVTARLNEIDKQMSVFREDSEISAINRAPAGQNISLSPDMQKVMRAADTVYRQSGGAFDPTLGRLIDMWGFGAGKKTEPSPQELSGALADVGFDKLGFTDDFGTLRKTKGGAYINLSAIAKGYGVDAIAQVLDDRGCTDYIVEIGGEVKAKGLRNASAPWNIGINRPQPDADDNISVVALSNMAVATSGNYRNFYQKDGQNFGHTISARTGRPVQTDVLSASVFNDSCMYADAYATAIVALGVDKGLALADKYRLKAIIYDTRMRPHFSKAAAEAFEE